ncbi:hypothetical protein BU17DRAFT_51089 [Hysterangium stoloniferum]|nr:hypothetical protein BU17DRAFT_51089 [Hysterangium stoloniferum]
MGKADTGQLHVCGLLSSTNMKNDHWQATDFVAMKTLIGCPDERAFWLCGTDIRSGPGFLFGDPDCDRIIFDSPPFETMMDTSTLSKLQEFATTFKTKLTKLALQLKPADTLCIVLCGHGCEDGGNLIIGDKTTQITMTKHELEIAIEGCHAEILLFSTACYSGQWTSQSWSLFAVAGEDQESVSITKSQSGNFRGGFFTNALLIEHFDHFNLCAPRPGPLQIIHNTGFQEQQPQHDCGPAVKSQANFPLTRIVPDTLAWLHALRDHIGKIYVSADFTFIPCKENSKWNPPFQSLIKSQEIQNSPLSGPNPIVDLPSLNGANSHLGLCHLLHHCVSLERVATVLSLAEESELSELCKSHTRQPAFTSGAENTLTTSSTLLSPLTGQEKADLLVALRERKFYHLLAIGIAHKLGWDDAITRLGLPTGPQHGLPPMWALQRSAENHGYILSQLTVKKNYGYRWGGAAGWLARIWEAAGKPSAGPGVWDSVMKQSRLAIETGFP